MIFVPEIPIGKKFDMLTILGMGHRSKTSRQWYWKVRCDCGVEKEVIAANIRAGKTTNCGCRRIEKARASRLIHGKTGTKIYRTWKGMRQRCLNTHCPSYFNYGGRGITMCDAWKKSFEAFYKDVGEPPSPDHSLDRIDNNKGYEPSNVRWVTDTEQVRNRRVTVMVEMGGRHNLMALCDEWNADYFRAYDMIVRRKMNPVDVMILLKNSKKPRT